MSVDENVAIVRRSLDALGEGDIDKAVNLYAAESRNHGRSTTREGMRRVFESLHALQERHTIEDVIAVDDKVLCRTTCHGVHAATPAFPVNGGILSDVAPTGRAYTVQHVHIFQLKDGEIVEH